MYCGLYQSILVPQAKNKSITPSLLCIDSRNPGSRIPSFHGPFKQWETAAPQRPELIRHHPSHRCYNFTSSSRSRQTWTPCTLNPVSKHNTSFHLTWQRIAFAPVLLPTSLVSMQTGGKTSQETTVLTQMLNLCVCSWGDLHRLDVLQSAHYFATVPSQVLPQPEAQSAQLPSYSSTQLEYFHLHEHFLLHSIWKRIRNTCASSYICYSQSIFFPKYCLHTSWTVFPIIKNNLVCLLKGQLAATITKKFSFFLYILPKVLTMSKENTNCSH